MADLHIRLISKDSETDKDGKQAEQLFLGYHLCLEFRPDEKTWTTTALAGQSCTQLQLFASVEPDGKVRLPIPDSYASLEDVTISVFAPDGEIVHSEYRSSISNKKADKVSKASSEAIRGDRSTNEFQSIQITVPIVKSYAALPASNGRIKEAEKLRVRVINQDGAPLANKKIAFFGKIEGSNVFSAQCAGATDSQGYFSCNYPAGKFLEVEARMPGALNTRIDLENRHFPRQLLISMVVPAEPCSEKESDCACETAVPRLPDLEDFIESPGTFSADMGLGECVSFTKPNRVQEEFDYYALVRTTEPAIRGLTLDSTIELPAEEISKLLDKSRRPLKEIERLLSAVKRDLTSSFETTRMNPHPAAASAAGKRGKSPQAQAQEHGESATQQGERKQPDFSKVFHSLTVSPEALKEMMLGAKSPDFISLAQAHEKTVLKQLDKVINHSKKNVSGRAPLNTRNAIDWDEEPTFYQACSIAHGHILHLKQTWRADGYSLGDLLYSLPLAPGQRRQIAVLDWERRETATRAESLEVQEELAASLSRDRDISEIVSGSLGETVFGASLALTGSASKGSGSSGSFSPNIATSVITSMGSSAGLGGGTSVGFQKGAREASANAMQRVRDKTLQSASAVRAQRSTVVQSVAQGETLRAQTETVANYNHCHATTVQYFEVLRHFVVDHKLSDVQECLFVPLLMSSFDVDKTLRWRTALTQALADRRLLKGFDALQRIDNKYENSDIPDATYAEDSIELLEGFIKLKFRFVRPRDRKDRAFEEKNWDGIEELTGLGENFWDNHIKNAGNKDAAFVERVGPLLASELTKKIKLNFKLEKGGNAPASVDMNLQSVFKNNTTHNISVHGALTNAPQRKSVVEFSISLEAPSSGSSWQEVLPAGTQVSIESAQIRYRTRHFQHYLINLVRLQGNLLDSDGVSISSPLSRQELINPRKEDREIAHRLLQHLNENLELYHRAIWLQMDPQRRYMLLDGIQAPNSRGRSVASVVENRIVGIVGNSLVLPVVPGVHLDPTYKLSDSGNSNKDLDLISHYAPNKLVEPTRITVPTRGVYAESVMGACNSCEKKDETRFWRWEESPIPDPLPQIQPINTDSRRSESPNLSAKDLPQPIINLQNAPALPDPSGFGALVELLGKADSFRDLSGLSENQKNALAALQSSFNSSNAFAAEAAKVAMHQQLVKNMGPIKEVIKEGRSEGLISPEDAEKSFKNLSQQLTGGDQPSDGLASSLKGALDTVAGVVGGVAKEISGAIANKDGSISFNAKGDLKVDQKGGQSSTPARILVPQEASDKDLNKLRAFKPFDKSGEVILEVQANSLTPPDAFLRLEIARTQSATDLGDINIEDLTPSNKLSKKFRLSAVIPGMVDLECLLLQRVSTKDDTGSPNLQTQKKGRTETIVLQSIIMPFSVPKYIQIVEDPVFDTFLGQFPTSQAGFTLLDVKEQVISHMKEAAEFVLQTANVRLIWQLGASPDPIPTVMNTIYNAGMINEVTVENLQPAFTLFDGTPVPANTRLGNTGRMRCHQIQPQQAIEIRIWPGGITNPANQDLDPEMVAIVNSVTSTQMSEPEQLLVTAKIVGRYIGETIAHEIGHSIIGCIESLGTPASHSNVGVMRDGPNRPVIDRTGIDVNSSTSDLFPTATTAPDLGVSRINPFDGFSQSEIDNVFPVIPPPMIR